MGTVTADNHSTGSRAALLGGTTTFIEMLAPPRSDDLMEGVAHWKQLAAGNTACDYTFHIGVTKFDDESEYMLRSLVADCMCFIRIFSYYKHYIGVGVCDHFRFSQH